MRVVHTLALTGSLLVTAAANSGATTHPKAATKKASKQFITCPITHDKVLKSKAIKVTAANGKSTYVCCKDCIVAAKKQLMAHK
jgi:hypothetical protein